MARDMNIIISLHNLAWILLLHLQCREFADGKKE